MGISKNLISIGLGALGLCTAVAWAAETEAPAGGLEEIVVTAEKRSESLQNVPLSITTFGSVALEEKAIANFFDYGTKVPNLAFGFTGDGVGTARTVSIRGISGDNTTGFYVDDTPLPDSIDPRVLDIDHIEVLRGPQGTLYGARSMGGTVRIITKTPDLDNFSGEVHGGASSTWHTDRPNYTGDAVFNIPLVRDVMALRISGFYDEEAGYFKRRYCDNPDTTANNLNATPTCTPLTTNPGLTTTVGNVGAINTYGGAAALTIKLGDALTITPRLMTQRADYNGFPMADVLSDPSNGYGYPVPSGPYTLPELTPTNFTQGRMFNLPEGGYGQMGSLQHRRSLEDRRRRAGFLDGVLRPNGVGDGGPVGLHLRRAARGLPGHPEQFVRGEELPALRRGIALRLRIVGTAAVRDRRFLFRLPRPPAVRLLLSALRGAGLRCGFAVPWGVRAAARAAGHLPLPQPAASR